MPWQQSQKGFGRPQDSELQLVAILKTTVVFKLGLNHPQRGFPSTGNQIAWIVSRLLASAYRGRFEARLNWWGERWPALKWQHNEQTLLGHLCCHRMGAFHSAWTTNVAGYHDTLVAKQRGHHKQIPYSQNDSPLFLYHKVLSSSLPHHNLPYTCIKHKLSSW